MVLANIVIQVQNRGEQVRLLAWHVQQDILLGQDGVIVMLARKAQNKVVTLVSNVTKAHTMLPRVKQCAKTVR